MKTIGLIGGMSWESTQSYYQLLNQGVKNKLGGLHSAKIVLVSLDFAEIAVLQQQQDWPQMAEILIKAAKQVEAAGADYLLICTNTMHKLAEKVQAAVAIPLLHIADAVGENLIQHNFKKVALLGTQFTMEQDFYKQRLADKFAIDVLIPDAQGRETVHRVIYDELCKGIISPESKTEYLTIIDDLTQQGAEAIILGCTEIALLVQQSDTSIPLLDSTALHCAMALENSLN
ncbi:aspartate/glutamate racemase family protein [Pseudoalteromonas shioyasakiensis]|uniref:Aspartate/glutamate racemase family protein n=1 Tax=Pseudoalteromonas shioyasakiensis TaxID=1190813 RepID=A0ABT6TX52_9GAMM|nr:MULTISPECIES: aspartate/glutamate racemase family protein [Pseudoalteromonas]MDI4668490.1 aspartate/glutamate racemase family protein [Pseudoalteromonas shioyasakiensis]MDI4673615.1 aspartate/glutamate racemase family protein [Pseudoalteromonas shioyasakiensis]MDI4685836.1 aspartate/glutamate racemase family protein [Pseudoalteromonas shioyasakiensis]MDI4703692.1 aspartate/glutamate racemase family protein [Pseudoalteromonas shioyasakiensis]NUJ20736.1 aspartate/glutamate racemase family pro